MSVNRKSEHTSLAIAVLVVALLVFSVLFAQNMKTLDPAAFPGSMTIRQPGQIRVEDGSYRVFAIARMWQFAPAVIEVPAGSKVDFFVKSDDLVHGFNIPQKGISMLVVAGTVNKASATFDKPGVYPITCQEYCGKGHTMMQARVVVK
ncbi:cupredoxin domain-containing protein [Paraflavisolibacter sp. H34]|uniref:cupredoxin domain-containing protein n=1 Tax=Huijunlia imazamoxiresistens TaxID=3127457 RepID=UPI003016254E